MISGVCKAKLSQALQNRDIVMVISVNYVMYQNWTIFSALATCHSAPESALRPSLLRNVVSITGWIESVYLLICAKSID